MKNTWKYLLLLLSFLNFGFDSCKDKKEIKAQEAQKKSIEIEDKPIQKSMGLALQSTISEDILDLGNGRGDQAWSGAETKDGGLLIIGSRVIPEPGKTDQFRNEGIITHINKEGETINQFVRPGFRVLSDIKRLSADRFIITGTAPSGNPAAFIMDDQGNFYEQTPGKLRQQYQKNNGGGEGIFPLEDGGFLLTCRENYREKGKGPGTYLIALDDQLNPTWCSETLVDMWYTKSAVSCNGYYVTVSQHQAGSGVYVASWKISSKKAKPVQEHIYGYGTNKTYKAKYIAVNAAGDQIGLTGRIENAFFLITLDPKDISKPIIDQRYSEEESSGNYAQTLMAHSDGGWVLAGRSNYNGSHQMSAVKVDALGNQQGPFHYFGGTKNDMANGLTELADGRIALFGFTNDVDKVTKTSTLMDTYVVKFSFK